MRPPGPDRPAGSQSRLEPASGTWRWALLLVGCVHLLTTAGAWSLTDHVEFVHAARRLLEHGSFALAEPGVRRVDALPWLVAPDEGPLRTRLLPGTTLSLVPLLALDRTLGTDDPSGYGRLVNLQGHAFVLAGLACLGAALRSSGASQAATAAAIVLTGLTWPVWLIARRLGSEPILFFLVCLFIAAATWEAQGRRMAARLAQFSACAILPWVSPTGPIIGLCLAASGLLEAWLEPPREPGALRTRVRSAAWASLGLAFGVATLLVFWNWLYHGHWWLGGYAPYYATHAPFGAREPVVGFLYHLWALVLEGGPLLLVALLGVRASPGRGSLLLLPACLTLSLLLMFASFHQPEPTRRLAVVWPAFGAVVGWTWDRLKLPPFGPHLLLALAGLIGFYWLIHYEGRRFPGPAGLFYPNVVWVERYLGGAPVWHLLPAAGLLVAGLAAGARTWRLLRPTA